MILCVTKRPQRDEFRGPDDSGQDDSGYERAVSADVTGLETWQGTSSMAFRGLVKGGHFSGSRPVR